MVVHTKDIIDKVPPEKNMAGVIVIVAPSFLHDLFHPASPIPVEFYVPQFYMTESRIHILAMSLSHGNFKAQEKDNLAI